MEDRTYAPSFKVKGFSCFTEEFAGFDQFKRINLLIGKNNSGKSQLLDFVEAIGLDSRPEIDGEMQLSFNLSEKHRSYAVDSQRS